MKKYIGLEGRIGKPEMVRMVTAVTDLMSTLLI